MIQVKAGTIITHCVGWILFLMLPLLFINGQNENASILNIILSPFYWLFLVCYALLYYSHTYYVFPSWYSKKKYLLYVLYLVVFLALIYFISPFDKLLGFAGRGGPHPEFHPDHFPGFSPGERPGPSRPRRSHFDIVSIILYFLTLALSITTITLRQLRMSREKTLQAETKKAHAELSFLKAQINPHFLFNTLNNIYALATLSHENTAPAILKLSNILRYVTDEISDDFVPLESEINCIRDYIDLQQLRISTKTTIEFKTKGIFTLFRVPPMVMMTYIENAFKFGISNHESSVITIMITAEGNEINFFCRNTIFDSQYKERTGIGLENTKQRLDYLYKEKYDLHTEEADGMYTVRLRINN